LQKGKDIKTMKALGLCLGASTVSIVALQYKAGKPRITDYSVHPHEGNPQTKLIEALVEKELKTFDRICVTGRKFRSYVNLSSISEPEAVEYAYRFIKPADISCPAVVSTGGETFMAYVMDSRGKISNVLTGNKCASGTGEFFLQQLRRMNVTLEEAAGFAVGVEPYHVSGRCSVFCKSDCTHATNKGIPKSKVTAGLSKMMAGKILELLKKVERRNIMITGGTSANKMMIEYLQREIDGLIVPPEAPYFEALGAALWAGANETMPFTDMENLFKTKVAALNTLPALSDFLKQVEFKTMERAKIEEGDTCILGLDVGSTTTKAVLIRKNDNALLADIYLRTNGDPVGAARMCYGAICEQIAGAVNPGRIIIEGLGVCGSGRQIAGLHALTDGVINEIIAHATAAAYFDPEVDTIFEIGGQDAKYTYLTNAVSSDYAMNEACSAGTGSFLEESAYETMGVKMEDIAAIALTAESPPNFNDQCAAFISSDIKNAISEGVAKEDIIAGLVYSICMNYCNRVKGNRKVGRKVFMQGGVCYNRAVPLAMSALTGKAIIVPPEPGLMGAFGVALEVKKRIDLGLMEKGNFSLQRLIDRDVKFGRPFVCKGGREKCDRRCEIAVIELEGKKYSFGGACNRYYNMRKHREYDVDKLDLIALRRKLIFEKYAGTTESCGRKQLGTIGFNRSFLVNTYYPFYSTFFADLGYEPQISDNCNQEGIDAKNSSFCYPVELAHGFFHSLLTAQEHPDYIFLPHFKAMPSIDKDSSSQVCPFVQGETFYLQTTFSELIDSRKREGTKLLTPLLDLSSGIEAAGPPLLTAARQMGVSSGRAKKALRAAVAGQRACQHEMQETGKLFLQQLEKNPDQTAIVIFGRSYSGFAKEANKGIPLMIASRGYTVIPQDFLPLDDQPNKEHMYWGTGQQIMQAAACVRRHPQLFGVFITNFSCGPDSFLIGYFRDIMEQKPSLTLELDSHTANAGLETRIEAFLDIIASYRQLLENKWVPPRPRAFRAARTTLHEGAATVVTSSGKMLPMTDPRVTLLFPSMGEPTVEMLGAVFRGKGFHSFVQPPVDEQILKIGRANTTCKECLPLILTTGVLLNYTYNVKKADEIVAYFMPTGSGPCRFGQYSVFMKDLINRLQIPDVAVFSLSSENGYIGLDNSFRLRTWWAGVIADVLEDIRSLLLANAKHPQRAIEIYREEIVGLTLELQRGSYESLQRRLGKSMDRFAAIPQLRPPRDVPTIALVGEIFVRRDALSRQSITERLAERGFATICSPVTEWLLYTDYLVEKNLVPHGLSYWEKVKFGLIKKYVGRYTRNLNSVMEKSGLVLSSPVNVDEILRAASPFISPHLVGEAILTVGSALLEVATNACGVISIGPFGCMPSRVAESVLNSVMHSRIKLSLDPKNRYLQEVLADVDELPFLAIESDGSPFPQLIAAKMEAFCLRAGRMHENMLAARGR
jgi:predicted CoA-substrate-specific enzyme activase